MALACTAARKRVYAKAPFNTRDRTGQRVLRHVAPLVRSRTVRFNLLLATFQVVRTDVLEAIRALGACQCALGDSSMAVILHAPS